jgi:YjjG family noncanonical pyrimidine nucleotidase
VTAGAYRTILFDLDHTLFDSDASEALALEEVLRAAGVDEPERHRDTYDRINRALWAAVELQQVSPLHVRTARFEQLVAQAGLDADPFVLADGFVDGLARHGDLYPGVREALEALAGRATLALVTNGLSEVQRGRLERLALVDHFAAVVISAEVGVSKPSPAIFDLAFEALGGPPRSSALMVGDSLTSDIAGGRGAGISTCWYNPTGRAAGDGHRVDHEIADIGELLALVAPAACRRSR